MKTPGDRHYTTTHEWAKIEGELVRVGITDYAQDQLGDIVFLELPEPGREVEQGEAFGVIESVKAVEDLHAPVAGEIVEANGELLDQPETVADDPYDTGWMIVLRPRDATDLGALMDAPAYEEHCEAEEEAL